jgi:hypothetical protein
MIMRSGSWREKYGDPDDLLREDWIPQVPGITCAGSYDEYSRNPGKWIYRRQELKDKAISGRLKSNIAADMIRRRRVF